jgi:hypothetical protein
MSSVADLENVKITTDEEKYSISQDNSVLTRNRVTERVIVA